ncbi:MAG TPA: hypothetical protein VJ499_14535 [Flavisolibacter sp.]|nr:hypothetical protein [Flavisolibacter sp.]
MRPYPIITAFVLLGVTLNAQTSISGVINSYHKVIDIIPSKACVRVDNASGLAFNDRVMIIQMKGATVNTTNTSSFGSITSLNNAGNYEIGTICSVRGDSVFLFKQLLRSYTVSDKVQLVRIPQYDNAIVTDSLKAMPWDSTTGKGGVLALWATDNLVLNAPISVSSAGYAGGRYMTSNGNCSNFLAPNGYYYNATVLAPQDGAYKGESVADLAINYSGGKGAIANGGGGGNNHNNGGGGGSNSNVGGSGGGNSSSSGCTTPNPGKGGNALNNSSGAKIFLGGGGGAGHANSGFFSTGGGNGGGVLFLQANTLYSNGYKILANGQDGGNTLGDGASGGGGGGSIILNINSYADAINIEAKGGNGGSENDDNTSGKCYGEGGGGSGGVIYFKGSVPTGISTVTGGAKGNKINSLGCGTITPGTAGTAGITVTNYSFSESSTLSGACGTVLPVGLLNFTSRNSGSNVILEWKMATDATVVKLSLERNRNNTTWSVIQSYANTTGSTQYRYEDKDLQAGFYQYRLQSVAASGSVIFSNITTANVSSSNSLFVFPNPASSLLTIVHPFEPGTELSIVDAMGKQIWHKKILSPVATMRQDISFLPHGMYRVITGQNFKCFVVQ